MMDNNLFYLQIFIISVLASLACVLPGTLLVLRGMALISDAISHSMLLGIVVSFLCFHHLHSPLMMYGALFSAFLTVIGTEQIIKTKILKPDAAVGLVFPLFFSIAVLLISQYARSIHLDTDMILVGEILLAPLQQYSLYGITIGAKAIWHLLGIILVNASVLYLFFRQFQTSIFDRTFAKISGYNVPFFHYLLLFLTSCTTIVVFDIVGAVMSVALIIVPAATAFLWTEKMKTMIFASLLIATLSALIGTLCGLYFDVSVAGMIATVSGIFFYLSVFFQHFL
jgi:manganese/zinc/iron transport system permease protein